MSQSAQPDRTAVRLAGLLALSLCPFLFSMLGEQLGDTDQPWRNARCALAVALSYVTLGAGSRLYSVQQPVGVVLWIWGIAALMVSLFLWVCGLM